jgi:hypothetical protein
MDEFVLDLVEQCSFQKQRVMHLVMTSRFDLLSKYKVQLFMLKSTKYVVYSVVSFCLEMRTW